MLYTGRRQKSRLRTKTAPVDGKDIQGLQNEEISPAPHAPPRFQRRQSSPISMIRVSFHVFFIFRIERYSAKGANIVFWP